MSAGSQNEAYQTMPIRQDYVSGVTPELIQALELSLSPARFQIYREAAGYKDEVTVALYLWNVAIGQSFQFPLQIAEVALRNAMQRVLRAQFGQDWWQDLGCRSELGSYRSADIDTAERRIKNIYSQIKDDNIVAALMFGFWVALLHHDYDDILWSKHMNTAFPHLGATSTLRDIYRCADAVADLRNKIFHHEPVMGRNLNGDYSQIMKLIGWVCPKTKEWVKRHSSVPTVMRTRPR
jgi:hypothetical protein